MKCPSLPTSSNAAKSTGTCAASPKTSPTCFRFAACSDRCAPRIARPLTPPARACMRRSKRSSPRRVAARARPSISCRPTTGHGPTGAARRVAQGDAGRRRSARRLKNLPGAAFGEGVSRNCFWRDDADVRTHIDLRNRLSDMTVAAYAEARFAFVQSLFAASASRCRARRPISTASWPIPQSRNRVSLRLLRSRTAKSARSVKNTVVLTTLEKSNFWSWRMILMFSKTRSVCSRIP